MKSNVFPITALWGNGVENCSHRLPRFSYHGLLFQPATKKCELFWYIHSKHNKSKMKKEPTFGQNISPAFCSETNCFNLQLVILQQHLFVGYLTQHQSAAKTFPDFSFINAQMHSFWSLQGRSWLEIFTICSFSYLILLSKNFTNHEILFDLFNAKDCK